MRAGPRPLRLLIVDQENANDWQVLGSNNIPQRYLRRCYLEYQESFPDLNVFPDLFLR